MNDIKFDKDGECLRCYNILCTCEVKTTPLSNPYTVKRSEKLFLEPKEEKVEV